jgi:hypothetical protein
MQPMHVDGGGPVNQKTNGGFPNRRFPF